MTYFERLLLLIALMTTATSFATTHSVLISNFAFDPMELTVAHGDSVVWTNMDDYPHIVAADGGEFESGVLSNGGTFGYLFGEHGDFPYHCGIHSSMTAVIHVAPDGPELHMVEISNFSFNPAELSVNIGDTIRWMNMDQSSHTATASGGEFDSGVLNNGDTYDYVATTDGSIAYACMFHSEMTGVINVGGGEGPQDTNWVELNSPTAEPLNDVRFIDENTGWCAGDAGVARTTDGGDHWTLFQTPEDLEAVYFLDASEGWVCGNDGYIAHSTDGGASWTPQTSGFNDKIRDIWFPDAQNGWAGGRDGMLLHTTNGGTTWTPQANPAGDDIYGIQMIDPLQGWIAAADGIILHTIDGGEHWNIQLNIPGGEEDEFDAVFMLEDGQHGWVCGGQGRIYHTHDGGQQWALQQSGTTVELQDIHFTDHDNGWVCGAGGFLSKAFDLGSMWHTQQAPTFTTLNSIYFPSTEIGYLVTSDGRIFKHTDQPTAVDPREVPVISSVSLAANYPNPFNPTTTIEFSIMNAGPVKLQVFDILGRDVATLVNQNLSSGKYTAQFTGTNLSSGRYFYRLNAAGQTQTRMMTLLK